MSQPIGLLLFGIGLYWLLTALADGRPIETLGDGAGHAASANTRKATSTALTAVTMHGYHAFRKRHCRVTQ